VDWDLVLKKQRGESMAEMPNTTMKIDIKVTERGPIWLALDTLSDQLNLLRNEIESLKQRVSPVLIPVPPAPTGDGTTKDPGAISDILAVVKSRSDDVQIIRSVVHDIDERLQL
jgi:hypothetical protein